MVGVHLAVSVVNVIALIVAPWVVIRNSQVAFLPISRSMTIPRFIAVWVIIVTGLWSTRMSRSSLTISLVSGAAVRVVSISSPVISVNSSQIYLTLESEADLWERWSSHDDFDSECRSLLFLLSSSQFELLYESLYLLSSGEWWYRPFGVDKFLLFPKPEFSIRGGSRWVGAPQLCGMLRVTIFISWLSCPFDSWYGVSSSVGVSSPKRKIRRKQRKKPKVPKGVPSSDETWVWSNSFFSSWIILLSAIFCCINCFPFPLPYDRMKSFFFFEYEIIFLLEKSSTFLVIWMNFEY